ncbi:MAG: hypothetical protein LQ348_002649 [Seirophora lacunosa]|nr:MAG: hypothetical protein LQ344_007521 [Seirophora lacunosa]KAI4194445.1 MAG: hypothetical protein LQ348_002649 [Seirophora lacunosa]
MEVLRQSLVPRRISQIYADTKRTYEHMIQHHVTNIPQTATHTKLRIQKDRLIAWGLEWADSNAAHDGDIDDSLDRAGISDLVASIMSSIQDLLERADSIQPQRTISFPGAFPNDKPKLTNRANPQWTTQDLERLGDIVKDLTASIDTLCDLSRSRQALSQTSRLKHPAPAFDFPPQDPTPKKSAIVQESPNLQSVTRVDETLLQIPDDSNTPAPSSSPPSYESVAACSEDRVLAFMSSVPLGERKGDTTVPLLLEYVPVVDVISTGKPHPSAERYGELLQVQSTAPSGLGGPTHLGTLRLYGWVEDTRRGRIALIYEVPLPDLSPSHGTRKLKISTLLSFLHHGADTDSTNMPSLEDRFRLAFNLASSLLHLHAKKILHRNINSGNIVFFTEEITDNPDSTRPWKKGVIRRPFLISFDQSSDDHAEVEESFISNIYRHPSYERGQRSHFKAGYDVYSLGLILLEIGLWMPISKLWKTRYTRAQFKNRLQTIYTKKLSGKCGTNYMKVVEHCLKSGDQEVMIGDGHQPQSRRVSRLTASENGFYWKAFKVLERCCMIDDADEESAIHDAGHELAPIQHKKVNSQTRQVTEKELAPEKTEENPHLRPLDQSSNVPVEESTRAADKPQCRCKVWSHEIPVAFASYWQQSLEPKLHKILSQVIDRWESYSIEVLMAGESAEVARPTIYMVCASVQKARKVLQYVNQDRGLFDIKVSRGKILRSMAGKKKKRGKGRKGPSTVAVTAEDDDEEQGRTNHYQERPSCGASIGAYLDEQHLPPVSFGGTVLVNGEPYGMSVHHMLENDDIDYGLDDTVALRRSMAPRGVKDTDVRQDENDTGKHFTAETPPEALYPYEISDIEDEGYRSWTEEDDLSDFDPSQWDTPEVPDLDDVDMGDTPGVEPGKGETLLVTQPAVDDVDEGFFPNEEDVDEDHLASHTFGHIHASSGIRRTSRGAITHEVDWALIKIRDHRRGNGGNIIKGATRHCSTPSPRGVIQANRLGGLKVHALGRTSGLQTGTILPSMVIVKMPGRISHSQSWQVAGRFGVAGDSGAWVIDKATGGVCAHVLAWSERTGTAYVAPMEVLFEDMALTLGADVTLPGQESMTEGGLRGGDSRPLRPALRKSSTEASNAYSDQEDPPTDLTASEIGTSMSQHIPLSREPTSSPPVATSPPLQRSTPLGPMDPNSGMARFHPQDARAAVPKSCVLDSKRRSGSEMLMGKGEESFKANCRMSIG